MPACSVIREARGTTVWLSLHGRFEGASAWELSARLDAELSPEIVLDFSQVTDFVDHGVAVVATALQGLTSKRIHLRGLRQHQLRLFKYFGIEPADLLGQGEIPAATRDLLPLRGPAAEGVVTGPQAAKA